MGQEILNILIPVIGGVLALIGGFVTWYLNERSKRVYEEYKRKEEKYSELIRSLRGFYADSSSKELKTEFLNQLNLCWMYCPDEVIYKAYNFLFMIRENPTNSKNRFSNLMYISKHTTKITKILHQKFGDGN